MLTKVGRIQSGRAPEPYAFVSRFPDSPPNGNGDPADAIIDAIGRGVGTPGSRSAVLYSGSDARQMPVLIASVLNTDPLVRGWAVWSLGKLGWSRHVERDDALVPLEAMTHDAGQFRRRRPQGYSWGIGGLRNRPGEDGKTRPGKPKTNARAEPSGVIYEDRSTKGIVRKKRRRRKRRRTKRATISAVIMARRRKRVRNEWHCRLSGLNLRRTPGEQLGAGVFGVPGVNRAVWAAA